jgi:hypothetical protein
MVGQAAVALQQEGGLLFRSQPTLLSIICGLSLLPTFLCPKFYWRNR